MIKSKVLAGPSCLTEAAADEPLFVLRANDELAPRCVRIWTALYESAKGQSITPAQRRKSQEATAVASAMERWKKEQRN